MLKWVSFFLLFASVQLLIAQQDSLSVEVDDSKIDVKRIDAEDLETYKNDDAFNYAEDVYEEGVFEKFKRWIRNIVKNFFEAIFGVGQVSGILYFIFNILPYLLLVLLVVLLIKFFLKVNSNAIIYGEKASTSFQFSEEEHIIKNEDIIALISKAIEQKNYRLAIRYYYLQTLKFLTEGEMITWQPEKTNEDYIKEINHETLKYDFKELTRIYDYVWYGEFNIDNLKFNTLQTTFKTINSTIKTL